MKRIVLGAIAAGKTLTLPSLTAWAPPSPLKGEGKRVVKLRPSPIWGEGGARREAVGG